MARITSKPIISVDMSTPPLLNSQSPLRAPYCMAREPLILGVSHSIVRVIASHGDGVADSVRPWHRAPTALAPWMIRWGAEASIDVLRRSALCTRCGRRSNDPNPGLGRAADAGVLVAALSGPMAK